jgi:hypothetical protein
MYIGATNNSTAQAALVFSTSGGGELMRVDYTGNVGVGVSPAAWNSAMVGIDFVGGGNVHSYSAGNTFIGINTYWDGTNWRAKNTGAGALYGCGAGGHNFYSMASVAAGAAQTVTPTFVIDTAGKLTSKQVAKAWVNFDGSLTGTITPRASFNVTSVTKNGTGDWTVNFTTALADTNYTVATSGTYPSGTYHVGIITVYPNAAGAPLTKTTSALRLISLVGVWGGAGSTAAVYDNPQCYISIFGN